MKAIRFKNFGLDNLQLESLPDEGLADSMVRVEIKAISLNYRDLLMVQGLYNPRLSLPLIPCSDGAGIVRKVGRGVTRFKPGDRVCSQMLPTWAQGSPPPDAHQFTLGGPKDGLLANKRVLPENALNLLPDHLDFKQGACLPVAGLTAFNALTLSDELDSRASVLLLGTGGVSIAALQIAKAFGARVVVTSSSDKKLEKARALGADFTINYTTTPNWGKEVLRLIPSGVDVAVEVGGAGTFNQSVNAVRPGGVISLIGVLSPAKEPINLTKVLMKNLRVQGLLVGSTNDFADFSRFLKEHQIQPNVGQVFEGLDAAQDAFHTLATSSHFSKIVISF